MTQTQIIWSTKHQIAEGLTISKQVLMDNGGILYLRQHKILDTAETSVTGPDDEVNLTFEELKEIYVAAQVAMEKIL